MIKGIQNVYVSAIDIDQAVSFYRDVMGLPLKFQDGKRWAQFDVGNSSFSVSSASKGKAIPGEGAVPVFEVDDLEAALVILRERGADIDGELTDIGEHGRYLTVCDPSGTRLQLFQKAEELTRE